MFEHLKEYDIELQGLSYQLGPRLPFDPKTERFEDNEKANQMLTREYRKGFEVPKKG